MPCKVLIKDSSVCKGAVFSTHVTCSEWIFDGHQVFGEGWLVELVSFGHPDSGSTWKVDGPPRVHFGRGGRVCRKRVRAIRLLVPFAFKKGVL